MAIGDPVVVINPGGHSYTGKKSGKGTTAKNVKEGRSQTTLKPPRLDKSGKTQSYTTPKQHKFQPPVGDYAASRGVDKSGKLKEPSRKHKVGVTQKSSKSRRAGRS